ncbi:hypothetical protein H0A65_12040 [Alcaligenaceae bacterium]|nr:hypothetical protein [Alcaligenaceae bacterium]
MALLRSSNLLFFAERKDDEHAGYFDECFFVGIYLAPSYERLRQWDEAVQKARTRPLGWLWPSRKLEGMPSELDVDFVGGAKVCEVGKALSVQNIGAKPGYGPTLYACILELAAARGLKGVFPTREPTKILPKPKEIWRQFAQAPCYTGKIIIRPISPSQLTHSEGWLNQVFS